MKPQSWRFWQQPLTRREWRFVWTGVAVLALALLYVYVQQPIRSRVNEARIQRDLQLARLEVARGAQAKLPVLEERLDALRRDDAGVAAGLPPDKDEPQFLRDLARLTAARGVQVRELSMGAPAQAGSVVSYPFRLVVAGSADASRRFMEGLETMDRLVQVRTFSFSDGLLTLEGGFFSDPAGGGGPAPAGGTTPIGGTAPAEGAAPIGAATP